MRVAAIIPARGGSKGIPRKNLYSFNGKPLIYWNIEAAIDAALVGQVVVSTDDAEIAEVSRAAGATVIMRPDDISTDIASSEDALLHVLENLDEQPELTVFLQCTSPLTQGKDIDNCIQKLLDLDADSAFTATESHRFIWKNADSAMGVNHSGTERKRRQDLEKEYAENGAIYVMRTKGFIEAHHRFFGKTVISEMPSTRTWEIDTLEDGKESVCCSRGDGWGINRMRKAGIKMAVMSTEENPVVQRRCEKLALECFHQLGDSKIERFTTWCKEHDLNAANVLYVGNDENDIDCLQAAGSGVVPADAHGSAKQVADLVLTANGGKGAVRELCDMVLEKIEE